MVAKRSTRRLTRDDWTAAALAVIAEGGLAAVAVEPLAGRNADFAGREETLSTHRIWARYRTDILRGLRLTNNGRAYRIDTVEDADGSRRYLVIKATEIFQ